MANSLFDIFGDVVTRQTIKNVARQPLSNIENIGKTVSDGPYKPNEPLKPTKKNMEPKKSFLANAGKALQSTPLKQCSTPGAINLGSLIYTDNEPEDKNRLPVEMEFTRPSYRLDNYHTDLFDYMFRPELQRTTDIIPPTPPPAIRRSSMELDCSYEDEFFNDDFSVDSLPDMDLNLPDIF